MEIPGLDPILLRISNGSNGFIHAPDITLTPMPSILFGCSKRNTVSGLETESILAIVLLLWGELCLPDPSYKGKKKLKRRFDDEDERSEALPLQMTDETDKTDETDMVMEAIRQSKMSYEKEQFKRRCGASSSQYR
jgi:hypothetical protein